MSCWSKETEPEHKAPLSSRMRKVEAPYWASLPLRFQAIVFLSDLEAGCYQRAQVSGESHSGWVSCWSSSLRSRKWKLRKRSPRCSPWCPLGRAKTAVQGEVRYSKPVPRGDTTHTPGPFLSPATQRTGMNESTDLWPLHFNEVTEAAWLTWKHFSSVSFSQSWCLGLELIIPPLAPASPCPLPDTRRQVWLPSSCLCPSDSNKQGEKPLQLSSPVRLCDRRVFLIKASFHACSLSLRNIAWWPI